MTNEEAHIYATSLEDSRNALLLSVTVGNGFYSRILHKIANQNNYLEQLDAMIKQLEYQFNGEFTHINAKIRKLSPKERHIYELAS